MSWEPPEERVPTLRHENFIMLVHVRAKALRSAWKEEEVRNVDVSALRSSLTDSRYGGKLLSCLGDVSRQCPAA